MSKDFRSLFYMGEMVITAAFITGIWLFRPKSPESNFRVREADLKKPLFPLDTKGTNSLAEARIQKKEPLRLSGIRIDGPAHEILGISPQASVSEIQLAYRNRMKQYHPDRVGQQGSREWNDAQKIAEAINRAKDEMLKQRSGK